MANRDDEYHAVKRQRTDDGNGGMPRSSERYDHDPHKPAPSPVIHVRGLSEYVTRQDIWERCEKFGRVAEVMLMSKKKQALVEFEDIQDAINCIQYSKTAQIYIGGATAGFNFSTSQRIQRDKLASFREQPSANSAPQVNHILLFTILEPIHPITIEVMKTICNDYGKIQRIVIFRKSGVQSMVEFDSTESATLAMQALQGQDIYTNCCTLRIEYAKANRVNVRRNDPNESWDFTIPNEPETVRRNRPLLADPLYESHPYESRAAYSGGMSSSYHDTSPMKRDTIREDYLGGRHTSLSEYNGRDYRETARVAERYPPMEVDPYPRYSDRGATTRMREDAYDSRAPRGMHDTGMYGAARALPDSNVPGVLMIYGLNMEKMNCQKLFNLLCLYGNVNRIKFLMKKEGTAMVELSDCIAMERAIQNLNNVMFHGTKMQATKSKQSSVQEVINPHKLYDGTLSYEDFSRSRNNRYTNPKSAEKNRIQAPSSVLHYFNAPPDMGDSQLKELFEGLDCTPPVKTKKFPAKSERSSSGLLEFSDVAQATEALIAANHHDVEGASGRSPFIFKLCFSSNHNLD